MPTNPIDAAIRETLGTLNALGLSSDRAHDTLRELVDAALARVVSGGKAAKASTSKPVMASKALKGTKPAKAPKTAKGGRRGPVPGGRQLKAHLGAEAFDALDPVTKDKGRKAISKVGTKWGSMSPEDRTAHLAPVLKGATGE